MKDKNEAISRLQIIAGFQLVSIIIQLALGIAVLVVSSVPEFSGQSVNSYSTLVVMLFMVFLVPAIGLAINGFWLFMADCILGIISWIFVSKTRKSAAE